jgi:predicted aspartyl protease
MLVRLFFRVYRDKDLENKVQGLDIIRLKALIRFKTPGGWTNPYEALVDTGAPLTLIPPFIWEKLQWTKLADHATGGIAGGAVSVQVARVTGQVLDRSGHVTQELKIIAFLSASDEVPLIIGFKDLLESFENKFDYRKGVAYLKS